MTSPPKSWNFQSRISPDGKEPGGVSRGIISICQCCVPDLAYRSILARRGDRRPPSFLSPAAPMRAMLCSPAMLLPSMMEVSMPYARTHIVNRAVEFPSLPFPSLPFPSENKYCKNQQKTEKNRVIIVLVKPDRHTASACLLKPARLSVSAFIILLKFNPPQSVQIVPPYHKNQSYFYLTLGQGHIS